MTYLSGRRLGWASMLVAGVLLGGCFSGDVSVDQQSKTRTSVSNASRHAVWHSGKQAAIAERYHSHIAYLANDALQGRGTGSHGIDLAAGYVAGQFAAAGLKPGGNEGTYFQEFKIYRGGKLQDTTELAFDGVEAAAALKKDYVPLGFSAATDFKGELVFVGYGITNPDKHYDDYAHIDVDGKVVLMLRREPVSWHHDNAMTKHASFKRKVGLAVTHGATAVLIVNQTSDADGDEDNLVRFRALEKTESIPVLQIKRHLAEQLLVAGGLPSLDALQTSLDEQGATTSATLPGVQVHGHVDIEKEEILGRNVVGILPGRGRHADEFVVIGAHYDHLGMRRGRIYNGADDNASGTAGVIELAYAFSKAKHRDRSIVFITFAGEELGLHGSKYFSQHPTVPLQSISAMINMDMIGRLNNKTKANMLAIQGLGTGDSFKRIVSNATKKMRIHFIPDDSARGPSDHASFYQAGIPSLFFFTGVHPDYHQPGDDVEKINIHGAIEIVSLVQRIADKLINRSDRPAFAEVSQRANIFRDARPRRRINNVVMGITPDFEDDSHQPGWRIADVSAGGGAAQAGMKAGDRIRTIDGTAINNFGDYMKVTEDKKPGDSIAVEVTRGADHLTLHVTLGDRAAMMRTRGMPRS